MGSSPISAASYSEEVPGTSCAVPDSFHDSTEAVSLAFPYREVSDHVGLRGSCGKQR
jgi:hypothetical protein